MLTLVVKQNDNHNATIEICDATGNLRSDIYVEIRDGKVILCVTDEIVERNSDDPTTLLELLARMPSEQKQPGVCDATQK